MVGWASGKNWALCPTFHYFHNRCWRGCVTPVFYPPHLKFIRWFSFLLGFFFFFRIHWPFPWCSRCTGFFVFYPCATVMKYAKLLILSYFKVIFVFKVADCTVFSFPAVLGYPLNKLSKGYNHSNLSGKNITMEPVTP